MPLCTRVSSRRQPARRQPGQAVVAAVRYGATEAKPDRALLQAHLARAGVREEDVVTSRFLARMVVAGAAPIAARGGLGGRPAVDATGLPGVYLAGDWVGPTGLIADAALASGASRRLRAVQARPGHDRDVSQDPFEAARPRIRGLAYRMLGTLADADDVAQDTWLRWHAAGGAHIANAEAWLVTTATRLCLDRLRSAARTREIYPGPWLPEPIVTDPSPESAAELSDSLTLGFLVLLDQLAPVERAVFVLADVFDVPYAEIAATVGRSRGGMPADRQPGPPEAPAGQAAPPDRCGRPRTRQGPAPRARFRRRERGRRPPGAAGRMHH